MSNKRKKLIAKDRRFGETAEIGKSCGLSTQYNDRYCRKDLNIAIKKSIVINSKAA